MNNMPSEGDQRKQTTTTKPHPAEPENLPCPRCESTNTKFCYYNNYNLSQPRYFCKSCRRYWTRGGTLRNVPVGGGSRKNSKRSRPPSSVVSTTTPPPIPTIINTTSSSSFDQGTPTEPLINLNVNDATSFMSLLTANSIDVMGHGLGFGQADTGFGYGFGSVSASDCSSSSMTTMMMMDGGDCLAWPELAISMTSGGKLDLELD